MRKKLTPNFREWGLEDDAPCTLSSAPGLYVIVMATTDDGTIAALNAASWLAKDLDARIALLKLEVVLRRVPLDESHVSLDFATKRQCELVLQSSAREEEVTIRTCLCHDRDTGLRRVLRRRALVLIGGRRRWWLSGEERLEQALRRLGHHVIFIELGHAAERKPRCEPALFARRANRLQTQQVRTHAGIIASFVERRSCEKAVARTSKIEGCEFPSGVAQKR